MGNYIKQKHEAKLINRKPYKEYLITRILGYYETDSIVLAAVMENCLDDLMKEVPVSQPGEDEYANMVINPRRHEAFLQKQILAFQKQGLSVPEEALKECLATLQKQPNVLQPEQPSSSKQSSECVSREEYETMRADRDSWKDAYGESNELAAAEVKRREAVERENERLKKIIIQHLPGDAVCACCEHFAQCKQEALEENGAAAQAESIFWNCDGFSRFVPKEEG